MNLEHVQEELNLYLEHAPSSRKRLRLALETLSTSEETPVRRELPVHLTAAALLINPRTGRFLQIHHRRLDKWIIPGGHVDLEDHSLQTAALRELKEETSLSATLLLDWPIDITIHFERESDKHSAHRHIDIRYLFEYTGGEIKLALNEVNAYRWRGLSSLSSVGKRVRPILAKEKIWPRPKEQPTLLSK